MAASARSTCDRLSHLTDRLSHKAMCRLPDMESSIIDKYEYTLVGRGEPQHAKNIILVSNRLDCRPDSGGGFSRTGIFISTK